MQFAIMFRRSVLLFLLALTGMAHAATVEVYLSPDEGTNRFPATTTPAFDNTRSTAYYVGYTSGGSQNTGSSFAEFNRIWGLLLTKHTNDDLTVYLIASTNSPAYKFYTSPALVGNAWTIVGDGMSVTTVELSVNTGWGASAAAFYSLDIDSVRMAHMTIDCNFVGNVNIPNGSPYGFGNSSAPFKIAGMSFVTGRANIYMVKVIRSGSQGTGSPALEECFVDYCNGVGSSCGTPGSYTWEGFPIRVVGNDHAVDSFPYGHIEIRNCVVDGFTSTNGGYCTAILVGSNGSDFDGRTAVVQYNTVENLVQGHAFGCASVGSPALIAFYANEVTNCLSCFNCDTGVNENVAITYNTFSSVTTGIHVGGGGTYSDFEISNNTISGLTDYFNPYDVKTTDSPSCGYKQGIGVYLTSNTSNFTVSTNTITGDNGQYGIVSVTSGHTGTGNSIGGNLTNVGYPF